MNAPLTDTRLDVMLAALRSGFERAAPFSEDRALIGELSSEAAPVLKALLAGHRADGEHAMHESFALAHLLGRRAGWLRATPTAALALARALLRALAEGDCAYAAPHTEQLEMVCIEGYCAGRDDRLRETALAALLAQQLEFAIAPGCHALVLCGEPPNVELERWLDEAMRTLFRKEVRCAIVDATRLVGDDEVFPRILASALITAASLGVQLALVAQHPALLRFVLPLSDAGQLAVQADFASAVAYGLRVAGHTRRRSWPEAFGFGRRRTDR